MSDKITMVWDSGRTVYGIVMDAEGMALSGITPETPIEGNRTAYAVPLAELDLRQVYQGPFPAVPAGVYSVSVWEQAGAMPDAADLWIGGGEIQWDGVAIVPIAAIKSKTDNLPADPAAVGSPMTLDLTQTVPLSNSAQTVGDALNAARAVGFGKWELIGTTLTLYAANGTTPVHAFTLDNALNPTSRA